MINEEIQNDYKKIRDGGIGLYEQKRGLIEVSGKEAVQFLNGLLTNDVAKLEENSQMLAAFPNAQGRLLAVVRILRKADKFLFETDEATHEKVFQNLFRFTFAGDFFVEDLSDNFRFVRIIGRDIFNLASVTETKEETLQNKSETFTAAKSFYGEGSEIIISKDLLNDFTYELQNLDAVEISDELNEILRIENGTPHYGVDMDETTIVPELGIENLISYNKGCYIGQEIIARIYFRGHVAKRLTGLVLSSSPTSANDSLLSEPTASAGGSMSTIQNAELKSADGKNAGKITSAAFSPSLKKTIALAYVRYDYLAEGTELKVNDSTATVKNLPFV